ncbi:MAG: DUF6923 family protein [Mycetocola sp.]
MTRSTRTAALAFLAVALTVGVTAAPIAPDAARAADGDPFPSDTSAVYITSSPDAATGTAIDRIHTTPDGAQTTARVGAPAAGRYNAAGWNPSDGYAYAMTSTAIGPIPASALIRIGQGNTITRVGTQTYSLDNPGNRFFVGDVNTDDGLLYVGDSGPNVTFLGINTTTGVVERSIVLPQASGTQDLAYSSGYLWGAGPAGNVVRIRVSDGQRDSFAAVLPPTASGYGAVWVYGNGNLGLSSNSSGDIVQLSISDRASSAPGFRVESTRAGVPSAFNDSFHIIGTPVDLAATIIADPAVPVGRDRSVTLVVTNHGTTASSGWTAAIVTPGATAEDLTGTAACSAQSGELSCTGGELAPGAQQRVSFTLPALDQDECATVSARVAGNEQDPAAANNAAEQEQCGAATPAAPTPTPTVAPDKDEPSEAAGSPTAAPVPPLHPSRTVRATWSTGPVIAIAPTPVLESLTPETPPRHGAPPTSTSPSAPTTAPPTSGAATATRTTEPVGLWWHPFAAASALFLILSAFRARRR